MNNKYVEFNESVFVMYHVLNSIYQNFDGRFPKEIDESMKNLIHMLIEYLDSDIKEEDEIIDIKYYRKLLLEDKKK